MQISLLRVTAWIFGLLGYFFKPYYWIRDRKRPFILPPTKNELLNYSANDLAQKIRNLEIRSKDVVNAYINRIKDINPLVNAIVDNRFEDALRDAEACDNTLQTGEIPIIQLEKEKPLYGVPFTVKESCSVKGLSLTGGSAIRRGIKADHDSLIVKRMREAGAIPLCVTNTPELCSGVDSYNAVYGQTVNPYDGTRTSGGSSGGESALLGSGASIIGIGSDIAGSIRIPGLFSGVCGHKPTPGIIPIEGHFPMVEDDVFKYCLVIGPMTRYVEDLHLSVKIMSRNYSAMNLRLDEPVQFESLKVYYLESIQDNFGVPSVDHDVKHTVRQAAMYFESRGLKTIKAEIPELRESCETLVGNFMSMNLPDILISPLDNPKAKRCPWAELLKSLFGCSQYSLGACLVAAFASCNGFIMPYDIPKYKKKLQLLKEKIIKMLGNDGVLLFPTWVSSAPPCGKTLLQPTATMYCLFANTCGLPSTQVPLGLNNQGLPLGIQIIAAPYQDRLTLGVAKELEKRYGGWIPPWRR